MSDDRDLPIAAINRIAKQAIPANTNIAKDAKVALLKASTHYILYAADQASEVASDRKRKTISAQDVLNAMERMGFEEFNETLEDSLELYRKQQSKKKEDKAANKVEEAGEDMAVDDSEGGEAEEEDKEEMEEEDKEDNDDDKEEDEEEEMEEDE